MWGFITVMNDVLINTFGDLFRLKPSELSYIQLSFFGTFFLVSLLYFIISSSSGKDPINWLGYKNGMAIGLLVSALGCGLSYLASINASYYQFIISLFVLSIGVTLLQICANPYVTILGEERTASSRLNLAQGLNSLGTTIGPVVGNILIYNIFSTGSKSIESVGLTYSLYGAIFLIMAFIVFFSKLPAFYNEAKLSGGLEVLKNRNLRFGILAIFFYVGAEVSIGSWIGSFSKDPAVMGLSEQSANYILPFFWGGLMIGRLMASISLNDSISLVKRNIGMILTSIGVFFFIWLVTSAKISTDKGNLTEGAVMDFSQIWIYLVFMLINFIAFIIGKGKPARMIVVFCSINLILLGVGVFGNGPVAFWAILGSGLFFSIGWSNIFSLSIKGLGKYTSQGSSLLVMAIVGGAVLPFVQSKIIENHSVQLSFIVPLLAMVYLIYFGINGYKRNTHASETAESS